MIHQVAQSRRGALDAAAARVRVWVRVRLAHQRCTLAPGARSSCRCYFICGTLHSVCTRGYMVGSGVDAGFIVTLYGFVGVVFVAVVVRVPCVVPSGEWSARSHQLGMPNILKHSQTFSPARHAEHSQPARPHRRGRDGVRGLARAMVRVESTPKVVRRVCMRSRKFGEASPHVPRVLILVLA